MKTILDIVNASRAATPPPRTSSRAASCTDATTPVSRPSFSSRTSASTWRTPARLASPTRWPRCCGRVGADGSGYAGVRYHGDVPLHAERPEAETRVRWSLRFQRTSTVWLAIAKQPVLCRLTSTGLGACKRRTSSNNGIIGRSQALARSSARRPSCGPGRPAPVALRLIAQANQLASGAASKLGLRTHLIIFGLAIVVPVLLYSAFLLHRYTLSERASNERRALAHRTRPRAPTSIVRSPPSSPRWRRSQPRRRMATKDFMAFHVQAKEALRSRRPGTSC